MSSREANRKSEKLFPFVKMAKTHRREPFQVLRGLIRRPGNEIKFAAETFHYKVEINNRKNSKKKKKKKKGKSVAFRFAEI